MFRFILAACVIISAMNASATPDGSVIEDLAKVDHMYCDIEARGNDVLRILTTAQNTKTNLYFDLYLADSELQWTKLANGWSLSKTVDLGEQAIAPLFPKFLYGKMITKIVYTVKGDGESHLSVEHTPSSTSIGSKINFECKSSKYMGLIKTNSCPACISNK